MLIVSSEFCYSSSMNFILATSGLVLCKVFWEKASEAIKNRGSSKKAITNVMFLYAPAGGHNRIWSLKLENKKYNACIIYQTQSICLNAIGRHSESAVGSSKCWCRKPGNYQSSWAGFGALCCEVGLSWMLRVHRLLRSLCLFLSPHLIFTGC